MMDNESTPPGNIYVTHRAIATIAYHSVQQCYGVVGLAAKNIAEGWTQALTKDPARGVDIHYDGEKIRIDLYIIIEYGIRIKEVAMTVASTVRFQVEKITGIPVCEVNIHIRGLRVSNID